MIFNLKKKKNVVSAWELARHWLDIGLYNPTSRSCVVNSGSTELWFTKKHEIYVNKNFF